MKQAFISYSHKDREGHEFLKKHFATLSREGVVTLRSDQDLRVGEKWQASLRREMEECRFAVLLISSAFLASDFICNEEVPLLLEREARGEIEIWPIFWEHSAVEVAEFSYEKKVLKKRLVDFQGIGTPDRPLKSLKKQERDRALVDWIKRFKKDLSSVHLKGESVFQGPPRVDFESGKESDGRGLGRSKELDLASPPSESAPVESTVVLKTSVWRIRKSSWIPAIFVPTFLAFLFFSEVGPVATFMRSNKSYRLYGQLRNYDEERHQKAALWDLLDDSEAQKLDFMRLLCEYRSPEQQIRGYTEEISKALAGIDLETRETFALKSLNSVKKSEASSGSRQCSETFYSILLELNPRSEEIWEEVLEYSHGKSADWLREITFFALRSNRDDEDRRRMVSFFEKQIDTAGSLEALSALSRGLGIFRSSFSKETAERSLPKIFERLLELDPLALNADLAWKVLSPWCQPDWEYVVRNQIAAYLGLLLSPDALQIRSNRHQAVALLLKAFRFASPEQRTWLKNELEAGLESEILDLLFEGPLDSGELRQVPEFLRRSILIGILSRIERRVSEADIYRVTRWVDFLSIELASLERRRVAEVLLSDFRRKNAEFHISEKTSRLRDFSDALTAEESSEVTTLLLRRVLASAEIDVDLISSLRLWDRALTPEETRRLFEYSAIEFRSSVRIQDVLLNAWFLAPAAKFFTEDQRMILVDILRQRAEETPLSTDLDLELQTCSKAIFDVVGELVRIEEAGEMVEELAEATTALQSGWMSDDGVLAFRNVFAVLSKKLGNSELDEVCRCSLLIFDSTRSTYELGFVLAMLLGFIDTLNEDKYLALTLEILKFPETTGFLERVVLRDIRGSSEKFVDLPTESSVMAFEWLRKKYESEMETTIKSRPIPPKELGIRF